MVFISRKDIWSSIVTECVCAFSGPASPAERGTLGKVTVGHVQTCPRSIFLAISAIVSFNFVLVNEYECVDPVHPLHKATNNFPTRLTDCHFIIRML